MTGKRRIVDGEVYLWTRRGWRLVRDGMIRTRRGWRKMRQRPRGTRPTSKPSPTAATSPPTDPTQPIESAPPRRQWHGKYAALQTISGKEQQGEGGEFGSVGIVEADRVGA